MSGGSFPAGDPPCPKNAGSAVKLIMCIRLVGMFPRRDWGLRDDVNWRFSSYHLIITVKDDNFPVEWRKSGGKPTMQVTDSL